MTEADIIEVERIKDRLRECTTQDDIHKVSEEERAAVLGFQESEPVMVIQITKLKNHMLRMLAE